jgi:hypothetical protein
MPVFGEVRIHAVDIDETDIDDGADDEEVPGLRDPGLLDENADEYVEMRQRRNLRRRSVWDRA